MRLLLALMLLTLLAVPAEAQSGPASVVVRREGFARFDPMASDAMAMRIGPSEWKTGAVIGGVALGLLTAAYSVMACKLDDSADPRSPTACGVAGFLGGALLGATLGGLIGSAFPKD